MVLLTNPPVISTNEKSDGARLARKTAPESEEKEGFKAAVQPFDCQLKRKIQLVGLAPQ